MEEVAVEAAVETVVVEEVGIPDPHRHHHPLHPLSTTFQWDGANRFHS